eukprot:jgi/Mesvir1/13677/Mv02117-RA.2
MNDSTFIIHPPKPSRPADKPLSGDPISFIGKNEISWESCNAAYREAIKAEKESARAGQLKRQRQKAETIRKHIALPCNWETGLKPGLTLWEHLGTKTTSSTPRSQTSIMSGTPGRPRSAALARPGAGRGSQADDDLSLCVPDTLLLGLPGGPVWLYTRIDGFVCRVVDFSPDDVIAKVGNPEAEDALVAVCKKLREDGSCETTLLNTWGLRALLNPRNVYGFTVVQSYIKSKGKSASVCRCVYKGLAARGLTPWLMTNKYDFTCLERPDMSDVLLLPTSSPNSCASVEQVSGSDATQLGFITLSLLSHLEARLGVKLGDMAADFIQDDDQGTWWFIGVKYHSVRQEPKTNRVTPPVQLPSVSSLVPPAVALFRSASARSGSRGASANDGEGEEAAAKAPQGDPARLRRCRSCQQPRPEHTVAWEMTLRTVVECMEHLKRRGISFDWFDHHSFAMVSDHAAIADPAAPNAGHKPTAADASIKPPSANHKPAASSASKKPASGASSKATPSSKAVGTDAGIRGGAGARTTLASAAANAKQPLPLTRKAMMLASRIQICTSCYKLYNEELKLMDIEARFAWELGLQAVANAGLEGRVGGAGGAATSSPPGRAIYREHGGDVASASGIFGVPGDDDPGDPRQSGGGGEFVVADDAAETADASTGRQNGGDGKGMLAPRVDASPEALRQPARGRPRKLTMFRLLIFLWGVEDLKIAPLPEDNTKKRGSRLPPQEMLPSLELSYRLLDTSVQVPLEPIKDEQPGRGDEAKGRERPRDFVAKKLRLFHVLAMDVDSLAAWVREQLQGQLSVSLGQVSDGEAAGRLGRACLPWTGLLPPEPVVGERDPSEEAPLNGHSSRPASASGEGGRFPDMTGDEQAMGGRSQESGAELTGEAAQDGVALHSQGPQDAPQEQSGGGGDEVIVAGPGGLGPKRGHTRPRPAAAGRRKGSPWHPPVRLDVMQPLQGTKCKGAFVKASLGLQVGPQFAWETIPGANRLDQLHPAGVWQAPQSAALTAFPFPQEWLHMLEIEVPSPVTPSSTQPDPSPSDDSATLPAHPALDDRDLERIASFQEFSRLIHGDGPALRGDNLGGEGGRGSARVASSREQGQDSGMGGVEPAHPGWAHAHRQGDADDAGSSVAAARFREDGDSMEGDGATGRFDGDDDDSSQNTGRSQGDEPGRRMAGSRGDVGGDGGHASGNGSSGGNSSSGAPLAGSGNRTGGNGLVLLGEGADADGWRPAGECRDSSATMLWRLAIQLASASNVPLSAGGVRLEFDLMGQSFTSPMASSTGSASSAAFNETWALHFRGTRSSLDTWLMRNMVLTLRASAQVGARPQFINICRAGIFHAPRIPQAAPSHCACMHAPTRAHTTHTRRHG